MPKSFLLFACTVYLVVVAGCLEPAEEPGNSAPSNPSPAVPNSTGEATPPESNAPPKADDGEDVSSASGPEAALRGFMIAMVRGDRDGIVEHSLDHPDLEMLYEGERPSADRVEIAVEMFTSIPLRSIAVGETYTLPTGTTRKVDDTVVNESRKLMTFEGNPIPFVVEKIDSQWKVDPSTVIVVRKTAQGLKADGGK